MEEKQQPATHIALSISDAEAIRKYLGTQPFDEAAPLIQSIMAGTPLTVTQAPAAVEPEAEGITEKVAGVLSIEDKAAS